MLFVDEIKDKSTMINANDLMNEIEIIYANLIDEQEAIENAEYFNRNEYMKINAKMLATQYIAHKLSKMANE